MTISGRFNVDWVLRDEYKSWLELPDNTKARCKLCMKMFSLSNMEQKAVKSHADGKKHKTVAGKLD